MEQIDAVETVLGEIGADVTTLRVYNKIDQSKDEAKIIYRKPHQPERVYVSAHTGEGMDLLMQAVQESLLGQLKTFELRLDATHGKLRSQLHHLEVIESERYDEEGILHLTVRMSGERLIQLIGQNHHDIDQILGEQATQFKRPLEAFEHH